MSKENRKNIRRNIAHPGLIIETDKSIVGKCTVHDVSATGARLDLDVPGNVPDEFDLLLSKQAPVRRRCKIVWRSEIGLGVRFLFPEKQ